MDHPLNDPIPAGGPTAEAPHPAAFSMTRWSLVRSAAQSDPDGAAAAMGQLFRIYWYPIYAFIRRKRGSSHHDAEDLTQCLFAHLLERSTLTRAIQEKGRFRTFLMAVLTHILANQRDADNALKRGGGQPVFSLDERTAEERYAHEPSVQPPDDGVYDRLWAQALVNQVLARLKNECEHDGNAQLFAKLEPRLTQPETAGLYADCARELGMKESTVRVALHRLRRRFGTLLRSEVAQTVAYKDEIDDELRHLLAALVG